MALHLVTGYRGSAHVTSADVGAFNVAFVGAGDYVCKTGKQFEAHALTNNTIRILDGDLLMQGRYVNLAVDTYEDVTIENGAQGMKRNDFIVCRYTKDVSSGTENAIFAVIKGTDTEGTASDPFVTTGNILSGALLHEMPLYRVKIEGISITKIEPLFAVRSSVSELTAKDVGARPSNWMPTAGDVGAPTLEEFNKQKSELTELKTLDLLWENASPSSEMGNATFSAFSVLDYKLCVIDYRLNCNYNSHGSCLIPTSVDIPFYIIYGDEYRRCTINSYGNLVFEMSAGDKKMYCVPYRIYGVK